MTAQTYVGAVDQGTTGTRFIVFDHGGQVVANAYEKHEQIYPEPGWVEHDPMEIWENTKQVITQALGQAGISPDQLEAIGVTNQRETTLLWDADSGRPVHNAIVWQDRRTTERVEELEENGKVETIREKTGLEADAYFSATKAEWLLEEADPIKMERARPADIRERAEEGDVLFGTIDTWLIYNLTGGRRGGMHVTDPTNASRTMLMNLKTLDWDDALLDAFGIPRKMLPTIVPSAHPRDFGRTLPTGPFGTEGSP